MIRNALRVVAVFGLLLPAYAQAVVVNLNPATDFWIRSDAPTAHGDNDGLIVDRVIGGAGGFESIASFDLSGITEASGDLVGATLDLSVLYGPPHRISSFGCCPGQLSNLFDSTTGTALAALDWNTFQSDYDANKTALTGLGVIADGSIADNALTVGGLPNTTSASAADLVLIKAIIDGASGGQLTMHFAAETATNRMYWGDTDGSSGDDGVQPAPLLTLDFGGLVIPPGDFDMDGNVTTLDFDIMKANWFTTGNDLNKNGEVTGDGIVDLRDFKEFKDNLFPGPASALGSASAVPEPGSVALLLAAAPTWLAIRRRRKRRGMGVS